MVAPRLIPRQSSAPLRYSRASAVGKAVRPTLGLIRCAVGLLRLGYALGKMLAENGEAKELTFAVSWMLFVIPCCAIQEADTTAKNIESTADGEVDFATAQPFDEI